jgi:uncharacterized protein YkwD
MKKLFLAASLLVSSLAFGQVKLTSNQLHRADSIVKSNIDFKSIEAELITLINAYRSSLNLDTLKYDSKVHNAAKCQVDYNISINKLTHDNIGELNGILERVEKFTGIRPSTAGEVLANMSPLCSSAFDQTIAEYIFEMWRKSPGHNAILISPKMKSIGVSINRKDNKSAAIFAGAVLNSL